MPFTLMYLLSVPLGRPMGKNKVIYSTGTLLQVLFMRISMNSVLSRGTRTPFVFLRIMWAPYVF